MTATTGPAENDSVQDNSVENDTAENGTAGSTASENGAARSTASENAAEFRFLPGDAERVGRVDPLPDVARVTARTSDGRTVSALAFDPEHPPQLVVLHGAGLNAHSFDPMLLALGVPALAIDLPGHGASDWRSDADYSPDHLAADVIAALEQLASEPVVLLGHSLGGLTAILVAAERPELVRRLIVVDITPGVSPEQDAGDITEFISGRRDFGDVDEIVDRAIKFGIGSDRAALTRGVELNTRTRPDGRLEWTHHLAHLEDPAPGADDEDPYPHAPLWASLQTVEAPVLLIRAGQGMVDEALEREWREQLPDAPVTVVAGPHNLHEAVPIELADVVRRELAGAAGDGAEE